MMTNIVDCDLDTITIGQSVKVVFKPSDGGPPVPMFHARLNLRGQLRCHRSPCRRGDSISPGLQADLCYLNFVP